MAAKELLTAAAQREGWTPDTQIAVLCNFIDEEGLLDSLLLFLDTRPEEDPDVTNGLWVETADRSLFILSTDEHGNHDEIVGPEDTDENIAIIDALMVLWRKHDDPHEIPDEEIEALGLTKVQDVLKRWGPADGYYHA